MTSSCDKHESVEPTGNPFSTKCQLEVSYNVIPKHYITMARLACII